MARLGERKEMLNAKGVRQLFRAQPSKSVTFGGGVRLKTYSDVGGKSLKCASVNAACDLSLRGIGEYEQNQK